MSQPPTNHADPIKYYKRDDGYECFILTAVDEEDA
jgi:hypothetical protein